MHLYFPEDRPALTARIIALAVEHLLPELEARAAAGEAMREAEVNAAVDDLLGLALRARVAADR